MASQTKILKQDIGPLSFVTTANEGLSAGRTLTAGQGITITDMGAGNPVIITNPYVAGVTPLNASNTGNAGAQLQVSLGGNVGLTTFLTQAIITSLSPNAQTGGVVTITDGVWTHYFQFDETTSAGGFMNLPFTASPLVATNISTAIVITIPVISGGAATAISAVGYAK